MGRARIVRAGPSGRGRYRTALGTFAGVLAALAVACGSEPPGDAAPAREAKGDAPLRSEPHVAPLEPNVVLITLDTTRADALNPYGQQKVTSPNLDRLAREGVVFERAATSSPSTLPSHASVMTGLHPFSHGARSNSNYVLSDSHYTLAERFQAHGYRTAAEIAALVIGSGTGLDQGFDRYRDPDSQDVARIRTQMAVLESEKREVVIEQRDAEDVTKFGKRFVSKNRTRPFFLWLHYFDPHRIYIPRPEYQRQLPDDPYLAEVLYTDAAIGDFIAHLEQQGVADRTIVAVVADHGEGLGEHGETTHSFYLFESTMRVPLLFWAPGRLPTGLRIAAPVRTIDIAPTLLELAALPPLPGAAGVSLLPLIRGEREDLGLTIYGETIEHVVLFDGVPLRTLRKGRWKYIHQQPPALYDLEEDPNELSNLAATRPEVVESLRAELEALLAEGSPAPADAVVEIDSDQARRLRALGYVVGASAPEASTLESLELSGPPHARVAQDVDDYGSAASMLDWGFYEEAVNYLEPLAARYPTSVPILSLYARALNSLERPEAREVFERILERHPCDSDALVGVDAILDAAKDVEARLAHLRSAVEGCPESPEMLNNYAYELATLPREDLRNGPEALRFAERAVKLDGGSSPAVLDTLAAAHAEVGDFAAAIRVEEKAVRQAMAQGWASDAIAVLRANLDGYRKGRPLRED